MVAPFPRSFPVWMPFSLYYTREGQENHENFPIQFTGSLKKHPLYSSRYLLLRRSVTPHITLLVERMSTEKAAAQYFHLCRKRSSLCKTNYSAV